MILRHQIRVDDNWTPIQHCGPVLHVGSRLMGVVEFWTEDNDAEPESVTRWYRVYGTGHHTDGTYVGTTYDGGTSDLVWHLHVTTDPQ